MIFNVRGIKIEISFLFIAFISFIISLKAPANLLITIVSSLFHETGHLFAMFIVGNRPKSVKFEMVGMNIIRQENLKTSTKEELIISLGGPFMNFIIIVVSCVALCFNESQLILTCACINLILMTFNLLPIKSLDGGMALYFLISRRFDREICLKILKITSIIFISLIYIWGVYAFISSGYNFSLLIIAIFLTLSMFSANEY